LRHEPPSTTSALPSVYRIVILARHASDCRPGPIVSGQVG
jgi:hypothetical protein